MKANTRSVVILLTRLIVTITKSTSAFNVLNHHHVSTNYPLYKAEKSSTCLNMAITPVGPFCPFRSSAAIDMEPKMESLNQATPEFATEMARLQLDMQIGQMPDPERLKKVAKVSFFL